MKLFNCTEGGIFIEGYEQFEDFINKQINFKDKQSVTDQLLKSKNSNEKNKKVAAQDIYIEE